MIIIAKRALAPVEGFRVYGFVPECICTHDCSKYIHVGLERCQPKAIMFSIERMHFAI